jgi:dethiobiotin synthetase
VSLGVFVTGTGTGVGKTVVAASIARAHVDAGRSVGVFKPVVSGLDEGGEADHELLRRAAGSSQSDDEVAPYRYGAPVSPHLAAMMADEQIDPERLVSAAHQAAAVGDYFVCEGVGGFLVPFTDRYLVRDFARELALPVTIAARAGLGTINHTLLTIEAVRDAGLKVEAVVLTPWPRAPSPLERDNLGTIARLGDVRVLRLPELDLADPGSWPGLPS